MLNSVGLTIHEESIELESASGTPEIPAMTSWELDPDRDFLFFNLEGDLEVGGNYIARMSFDGILNNAAVGEGAFWDSYYQDGETRFVESESLISSLGIMALST